MEKKEDAINEVAHAERELTHYLANRDGRPSGAMDDVKKQKTIAEIEREAEEAKQKAEAVDKESEKNTDTTDDKVNVPEETEEEPISEEEQELRKRSEEYDLSPGMIKQSLKQAAEDAKKLKDDLIANKQFHSLGLPQIGIKKRMFAIRHANDIRIYINPVIVSQHGLFVIPQREECAPEDTYIIFRPTQVVVAYTNLKGEALETELVGLAAAEYVKQCERLDGVLLWDFGKLCNEWESKSEQNQTKIVNQYLEELSEAFSKTQEVVQNDPELKEMTEKYEKIKNDMKKDLEEELKRRDKERRKIEQKAKTARQNMGFWN